MACGREPNARRKIEDWVKKFKKYEEDGQMMNHDENGCFVLLEESCRKLMWTLQWMKYYSREVYRNKFDHVNALFTYSIPQAWMFPARNNTFFKHGDMGADKYASIQLHQFNGRYLPEYSQSYFSILK